MRVLIAGDWHSDLHEHEVSRALTRLGHEVRAFKWCTYFAFDPQKSTRPGAVFKRAQNKYVAGPAITRINRDLIADTIQFRPEVLFVYRGTHIEAHALQTIRARLPSCVLVGYNNDDPTAPKQPRYLWRHFMAAIPHYDLICAYRHANVDDFLAAGARRVELLRSWFVPDRTHPVELSAEQESQFGSDVVFAGHYEADQRVDYLSEVVRQGFRLRLFGPTKDWARPLNRTPALRSLEAPRMVWGADYNRALCGSKIALCFLSKLNRDTYTRRCFEIPATRTLLLSEYSGDLASLYREGEEADFFRSRDEMIRKIRLYLHDEPARQRVADAGYHKVRSAGHDVDARMSAMLGWIAELRGKQAPHV